MGLAAAASFPAILEDELELMSSGLFFRSPAVAWLAAWCALAASLAVAQDLPPEAANLEAKGMLIPSQHAKLASRTKGVIETIKREGDVVKKGEVVMELESEIESLQLLQQKHILDLRSFERSTSDELASKSVISKTEVRRRSRSPLSNCKICFWMVTSSAVVGSSAINSFGSQAIAMAILMR